MAYTFPTELDATAATICQIHLGLNPHSSLLSRLRLLAALPDGTVQTQQQHEEKLCNSPVH